QLLGVTADNATNNDTMIDMHQQNFQGQVNHLHCFDHVINLVTKTLLHQFDAPKGKAEDLMD
ncbi:hypothetical protein BKA93DRAFT_720287, partial [Sparassis latifolia]